MRKILLSLLMIMAITTSQTQAQLGTLSITTLSLNSFLHFGSGFSKKFQSTNMKNQKRNINGESNNFQLLSYGFKNIAQKMDSLKDAYSKDLDPDADIIPQVIGKALVYPSPFQQKEGGQLGYKLSKNMDVRIQVYDMLANKLIDKDFLKGTIGGTKGYNKLDINTMTFDGYLLSAGVYFYLLIHNGKILTKGKMAVIP